MDYGPRTNGSRTKPIVHSPWSTVLFMLLFLACSPSKTSSPVLAEVNNEKITLADFQKAMEIQQWKFGTEMGLTDARLKQFKTQVVESLLKDKLLLQEADKRHIQISNDEMEKNVVQFKNSYPKEEDFEKLLQQKGWTLKDFKEQQLQELRIKKIIDQVTQEEMHLSTQDLQQYYEDHKDEFKHPAQVHARQLVTDSKEKAKTLRDMVEGGAPFEEVAKKYSLSPDRKLGGDLGWFGRGIMPQEFDQVCFHLKPGELSPVVKTPYGFHVFQVLEMRGAGQLVFDEVEGDIKKKLMETGGEGVFQKWYEGLRSQTKIEVHTEMLEGKN